MDRRELSIDGLILGSVGILRAQPVVAIIGFIAAAVVELVSIHWLEVQERGAVGTPDDLYMTYAKVGWWAFLLIYAIWYIGLGVTVTGALLRTRNAQSNTGSTLAGRRWFAAAGASAIATIGTGIGLVFFVIPGLLLMARWYIAVPIALDRSTGATEALSRSWAATEVIAWPLVLATLAVNAVPMLVAVIDISWGDSEGAFWAGSIMESGLTSVAFMIGLAMAVHVYRHVLRENDDLNAVFQ